MSVHSLFCRHHCDSLTNSITTDASRIFSEIICFNWKYLWYGMQMAAHLFPIMGNNIIIFAGMHYLLVDISNYFAVGDTMKI